MRRLSTRLDSLDVERAEAVQKSNGSRSCVRGILGVMEGDRRER